MKHLTDGEMDLLYQSQMTVNLLYEVATLRAENEKLREYKLRQTKMIHDKYNNDNEFIGNILSKMIENAEEKS